jgi:hypothetical protein
MHMYETKFVASCQAHIRIGPSRIHLISMFGPAQFEHKKTRPAEGKTASGHFF